MLLTILNITVCVCLDWRQRPWREEADEVVSRWWQKRTDPLSWPYCWLSVLLHGCKIQLIITSVNLPLGYIEATLQECAQNPSFKHMGVLLVEFSLLHSSTSCFLWKFVFRVFFSFCLFDLFYSPVTWSVSWWKTWRMWAATATQLVWGKCSLTWMAHGWCSSMTRTVVFCYPPEMSVDMVTWHTHTVKVHQLKVWDREFSSLKKFNQN